MSKYRILNKFKKSVSQYYEGITSNNTLTEEEVEQVRGIAAEYYQALLTIGVIYGKAGLAVTRVEGEYGKFENSHFLIRANKEGKNEEQIKAIQNNLVVRLMYRDIEMRIDKIKGVTHVKKGEYGQIAEYHYQEYKKAGLSEYAWSGTLFEEFIGSGSWMRFTDSSIQYKAKESIECAIHGDKKNKIGVSAKTAYESLLDTYGVEAEFINMRSNNAQRSSEFSSYDNGEDSIYQYIGTLQGKVLDFTDDDNCSSDEFSKSSNGKHDSGSLFDESKEVMDALGMFNTPAMQNPKLSNIERFEILRQQSEQAGNSKYGEMFGDIMDKHEAVFEALDELIENQAKDDSHGEL